MKKRIWIFYFLMMISTVLWSQPHPGDGRGPGNPGGDPFGNPNLGGSAPLDEFVVGIIIIALVYAIAKYYFKPNTILTVKSFKRAVNFFVI
jgi:hypothetical protein